MTEYQKLNRRLQETVLLNSPDVLTPKKCIITEITDEGINVQVQIGGLITLRNLDCYGHPIIGEEAILLPIYNDYNHSIVLCRGKEAYTKEEMDQLLQNFVDEVDGKGLSIEDFTTEKYGIITKIENGLCCVKETDSGLEHSNVPVLNGLSLKLGDEVVLGFAENSIYNPFVLGTVSNEKRLYSKDEIDEIIDEIEKGEIHIEDYDVGFTYAFGLGGVDDTISIHTFITKINGE